MEEARILDQEIGSATRALYRFALDLGHQTPLDETLGRTEELLLDWLGSALAGRRARPVAALSAFAQSMGKGSGPSEEVATLSMASPYFAALINGAASHVVEQDDLHGPSVVHPGTVVFPAALAVAQDVDASGLRLLQAAIAGYEVATRVGRFLGRSHYRVFHVTGTAGTLGAAAAAACLLDLSEDAAVDAMGSAGTQAAGLWQFLRDAADSKQLHTAKAAANGLMAAYLARDGLTGAHDILEGEQGLAAGMSTDADRPALEPKPGDPLAVMETALKLHASCRHTHPSADALARVMAENALRAEDIAQVTAHVYDAAIDVLEPAKAARTIHQAKFSMPFVLALIACRGHAALEDFTQAALADGELRAFMAKVTMRPDPAINAAYPVRWTGHVSVTTRDGRSIEGQVEVPRGEPEAPLGAAAVEDKFRRLGRHGGIDDLALTRILDRVRTVASAPSVRGLLR